MLVHIESIPCTGLLFAHGIAPETLMASRLRPGCMPNAGDVWALLIAGSAGWYNYRHVCLSAVGRLLLRGQHHMACWFCSKGLTPVKHLDTQAPGRRRACEKPYAANASRDYVSQEILHPRCCAQAYQVLKRGGVADDHIVVMHADDLAYDIQNPHAGKIYNKPGGEDVYAGLPKVLHPALSSSIRIQLHTAVEPV